MNQPSDPEFKKKLRRFLVAEKLIDGNYAKQGGGRIVLEFIPGTGGIGTVEVTSKL